MSQFDTTLRTVLGVILLCTSIGCSQVPELEEGASKQGIDNTGTGNGGSNNGGSSVPPIAGGTPTPLPTPIPPVAPLPTAAITCPATLVTSAAALCSANFSANLASYAWYVDGTRDAGADNRTSYTWNSFTMVKTYRVQLIGFDSLGRSVMSNIANIAVSAPPTGGGGGPTPTPVPMPNSIFISCPATVATGGTVACQASAVGNYLAAVWSVNDILQANSNSLTGMTWTNVILPAAKYRVKMIATASTGATVQSNTVEVEVLAPPVNTPPVITVSCSPTTGNVGADVTCSVTPVDQMREWIFIVNGQRWEPSLNQASYTWRNVPAGTARVSVVGTDKQSRAVMSQNEVIVNITDPLAGLPFRLNCAPTVVRKGGTIVCSTTATVDIASSYWLLDGTKVEGSDGLTTITWSNIQVTGIYTGQVRGVKADGSVLFTNPVILRIDP